MHQLVQSQWQILNNDQERSSWLALVEQLTNLNWELNKHNDRTRSLVILQSSWWQQSARLELTLDEQTSVNINIENWNDWDEGYGWLVLNALSQAAVTDRPSVLQKLNDEAAWQITRQSRDDFDLSSMQRNRLSQGQMVRFNQKASGDVYLLYPAGANQLISIGPFNEFEAIGLTLWIGICLCILLLLAFFILLIIRPLKTRLISLTQAVDAAAQSKADIDWPLHPEDDLSNTIRHIKTMAENLISQAEANKQLNMAVSHDIKTPLARMSFALSLLEGALENDNKSESQKYIDRLNTDVEVLTNLVQELLMFHRINSQSNQVTEPIDLVSICRKAVSSHEAEIEVDEHLWTQKMPCYLPAYQWQRLINNLLDNAWQYSDHRPIKLSLTREEFNYSLIIYDQGPGMTQTQLERMTQPFTRAEESRGLGAGNSGLGLAMVQNIIQQIGGRLEVCRDIPDYFGLKISIPTKT